MQRAKRCDDLAFALEDLGHCSAPIDDPVVQVIATGQGDPRCTYVECGPVMQWLVRYRESCGYTVHCYIVPRPVRAQVFS